MFLVDVAEAEMGTVHLEDGLVEPESESHHLPTERNGTRRRGSLQKN